MATLDKPSASTLIDERMTLFLTRRLRDILDHLPAQQNTRLAKRTLRALDKLKHKNFGVCEQCGYRIDIGRILQDPAVERCSCCEHGIDCPTDHPSRSPSQS